jgi:hypothetical protein
MRVSMCLRTALDVPPSGMIERPRRQRSSRVPYASHCSRQGQSAGLAGLVPVLTRRLRLSAAFGAAGLGLGGSSKPLACSAELLTCRQIRSSGEGGTNGTR